MDDLGTFRFKGVNPLQEIVSVKSQKVFGRQFPTEILTNKKGERIKLSSGTICTVDFLNKDMD